MARLASRLKVIPDEPEIRPIYYRNLVVNLGRRAVRKQAFAVRLDFAEWVGRQLHAPKCWPRT